MNVIDKFLNSYTMYRVILYGLGLISLVALVLSAIGILDFPLLAVATSLALVVGVGFIAHTIFAKLFHSATGAETWLITSLILFLILKPAQTKAEYAVLVVVTVLAMASKYVIAFANRHIFNPVAIALVVLGLLGSGEVYWWVGSKAMLPVALLIGLVVLRKTRRFHMLWPFVVVALITHAFMPGVPHDPIAVVRDLIISGPLVFFATIMLTEPATAPPTQVLRIAYSALVGLLYGWSFHIGPIFSTPEVALVTGNIFSYAVSSKRRQRMRLERCTLQAAGVYEFAFTPLDGKLAYKPGQYLEWTLPHKRHDSRGNRRYFTIASSPTETEIKLAARIDTEHSSTFKKALLDMKPGDEIWASQLGGDFRLSRDKGEKLVFIAGGIGITPFRSMVQSIVDQGQRRDITLLYTSLAADGFAYWPLFNQAVASGVKPIYVITGPTIPEGWTGKSGFITSDMIKAEVPDYAHAMFYLSGPNVMVVNYKKVLRSLGVPSRSIKTDYFPGF